ncbi:MAG TPA: HAD family acid phosphatase [Streptosporangiaceae bacterium]|jgi:hypothetical protein
MITRPVSGKRRYALAVIVAAAATTVGLVGTGVASAHGAHPASSAPHSARDIPNLGLVEDRIQAYYGDPDSTGVPSAQSNYARETEGVAAKAQKYLAGRLRHPGHAGKPALILDIDDTSLITYGYEVSEGFGFTPASNAAYLQTHTLPAVFGMTGLANWAASHGVTVFWITGRPESQRALTAANLTAVGYSPVPDADHLFLKPSTPPSYLTCGTSCTTIQYKSLTREHIASEGFDLLADMGDQFSDLKGGFADRTFKLPNPMYFIP